MQLTENKRTARARPAPRWRNVYWLRQAVLLQSGPAGPGRLASRYTWPSRDVAETKARETLSKLSAANRPHVLYIGAEPAL
jgi:hypothetical protein